MTESQPDKVTACLAEVRLRAENVQSCPAEAPDALWRSVHGRAANDVPRLLAAVGEALDLAEGWDGLSDSQSPLHATLLRTRAFELREAISRALLGEGE